ncbi:carbohydrate ABC transporter permease [Shinella granuli]|uniref:Carbohydrate ABC transporter membrane protein 1 (CUT1 family) n=1 Tax=Shinella granuli TaxID=323621 RepID=A0A4V2RF17_SHIGR|nr:sugar ABC transporter permease [Shinella granuli]TCN30700.1 carbohydrate ABC transporter membrane protein 1 (CUT1 family) [Shinella granuli]
MTSTSSSAWARVQDSPWFWLLPAGLFLLVFYTWPLLDVVRLSFTNASLVAPDYDYTFDSYRRVLRDPSTLRTLKVTFLFAGGSVILKLVLGMALALAIDAGVKRGLHGIVLVRTSVLAAWVIPGVVVGVLWKILLSTSSHGLLNYWIQAAFGNSVGFLTDPDIALSTAILANVWRGVAFTMILLYAGLQRIPPELYEAARVDGAGAIARFRFVTLPTLAPVIFIALVLITIGGINTFDLIMALTEGGPARATEVVGLRVYQQVFQFMNLGRGAALAVLLLAVNLLMTLIYLRLLRINRKTD